MNLEEKMKTIMLVLFCIFVLHLSATIINIPDDQPTIQQGINVAVDGDTVLVQPNTYFENINYYGKNITVASLYLTTQDTSYISQTIIDGNQIASVVTFDSGEDSTTVLTGFLITNGNANSFGGGISCTDSNPSLSNLSILNNSAYCGGGISCINSSPSLESMTIDNNMVITYGGGIFCNVYSNPNLVNVVIMNNTNVINGGGIYCGNNSSPSVTNTTISNNSAEEHGGGIYCEWNSDLNLSNSILIDNYADEFGGGFYIFESNPQIVQSIIESNSAYDGGGIYCYTNSNPIILYNSINNNSAIVSGGGIFCFNGSVSSIINNEFNNNVAFVGGISILDANPLIINNNFNHNDAMQGGGIHISGSSCIITNNTISNNTATYQGGGISISYMSSPITINTILWGNEANLSGNEIYIRHYDCEPEFYYCDIQGGLNAFGYEQGASFNGEYENNIDSDPLFLSSGEYPFSLLNDSPCIDAGIPDTTGLTLPEYDLAGNPRINNNLVDMGAFEWQGTSIDDEELVVKNCELSNYPNPFNPTTSISFSIPEESNVELTIFNIKGQKVKTLINSNLDQGNHSVIWNGTNESIVPVCSGIYFYKLNVNGKTEGTKKMLLLK